MSDTESTATLADSTVEIPPPHRSKEYQVADLLKQAASPAPAAGESQHIPEAPPAEKWDIKAVAEKLGADPAKLYGDLKVAFEDGTEKSVSELKDAYRPVAELEKARTALWDEVSASKSEVAQAQQELGILLQTIGPQNLSQDLLQKVSQLAEQSRQAEAEKVLKAIPEWKDPITRAADWADIRRVGKEYGYTDAEMRLAEAGHADHRLIRMARALAKAPRSEPEKPQAKVAVAPKGGKPQTQAQQFGQLKAAVTKGQMSQTDAVAKLLKGI